MSFFVSSAAVCEVHDVDCTASDDVSGRQYDLSPLARQEGNWEVPGPNRSVYILNVCRSLVQTHSTLLTKCSTSASACLSTQSGRCEIDYQWVVIDDRSTTLGYPSSLTLVDGTPTLNMQAGVCPTSPDTQLSVSISFLCNPDSLVSWVRSVCCSDIRTGHSAADDGGRLPGNAGVADIGGVSTRGR